jgi:hypothetical protein
MTPPQPRLQRLPVILRRRFASLSLILLFATSCSATGSGPSAATATAHISGPDATTDVFGNSRVTVRATEDGVSDTFTVTGGRYGVLYRIDEGTDNGCEFSLVLTPSKDGPIVQSTAAILSDAAEGEGDVTWTLNAGIYLLQEDETGAANCARGFSATITAQN